MPPRPPSWSQDDPKIPHLGSKMAPRPPNLEPRWPQDPPSWSQDAPKTPHLGAKMAPRPPLCSQDGPKYFQEPSTWSQDASQEPQVRPKMHTKTPQLRAKGPPDFDKISSPPVSKLGGSIGKVPSSELGTINRGAGGRGRSP